MNIKELSTDDIFEYLNSIKQNIGLAVCSFTNNQITRQKAIKLMETHFKNISESINQYYIDKEIKNIIEISIQLNENSDIIYWNNKTHLETLKIDLAHKFDIPLKCIETKISF